MYEAGIRAYGHPVSRGARKPSEPVPPVFADRSWRPADAPSPADPTPPAAVEPAVLDQALGSVLGHNEAVVIAAFVQSAKGRQLRTGRDDVPPLVAVTDRRIVKAVAWTPSDVLGDEGGEAAIGWRTGKLADRSGRLTRRYLWLGQIREVEIIPPGQSLALFMQTCALVLQTTDGRQEIIRGEDAILQELAAAIRDALAGPHRDGPAPAPASLS